MKVSWITVPPTTAPAPAAGGCVPACCPCACAPPAPARRGTHALCSGPVAPAGRNTATETEGTPSNDSAESPVQLGECPSCAALGFDAHVCLAACAQRGPMRPLCSALTPAPSLATCPPCVAGSNADAESPELLDSRDPVDLRSENKRLRMKLKNMTNAVALADAFSLGHMDSVHKYHTLKDKYDKLERAHKQLEQENEALKVSYDLQLALLEHWSSLALCL